VTGIEDLEYKEEKFRTSKEQGETRVVKKRPQEYKCNTETSGLVDDQ
jgi:hypothetical protein